MEPADRLTLQVPDAARRARTRRRLYAACQIAGWGLLVCLQILAGLLISGKHLKLSPAKFVGAQLLAFGLGALLTHYFRRLIRRWGWEQLTWRALAPRVLASSVVLGIVWTLTVAALSFGVLQIPMTTQFPRLLVLSLYCINDSVIMLIWLGLYFGYHIYERVYRFEIEQQRLILTVKEAELRALKSQVNPHFIFNSLNSLRSLIDEDPRRARLAVTQLANLLRYSLRSSQLETVPFEEELTVVKDYLALEQVRYEGHLRLHLDVDDDTLTLPVPPMLLQTLVENAVKYGIAQVVSGGEIAISAHREGGVLRIQVSNPGTLNPAAGAAGGSTGVGLRNAADRLRLLFGKRASLDLTTGMAGQVLARVTIPLIAAAPLHP